MRGGKQDTEIIKALACLAVIICIFYYAGIATIVRCTHSEYTEAQIFLKVFNIRYYPKKK